MTIKLFFDRKINPPKSVSSVQKTSGIDIEVTGDSGFRAVATGIVDNLLRNPRANDKLLKTLLNDYAAYFPEKNVERRLLSTLDGVEKLAKTPHLLSNFIGDLAFILRQIAVDRLVEWPEIYPEVFTGKRDQCSPEQMRLEFTQMDVSAIAALSVALKLPIEVQVVEPNKDLPLTWRYFVDKPEGNVVIIRKQHDHYIALLRQHERFSGVSTLMRQKFSLDRRTVSPHNRHDPSLSVILAKRVAEDNHLVNQFESMVHRLSAMVNAGEVTKDQLITLYIQGMDSSEVLRHRIKYPGMVNGSQSFFEELEERRYGHRGQSSPPSCYDDQLTKELIEGISRLIAIGQLDSEKVFAQIERDESARYSILLGIEGTGF